MQIIGLIAASFGTLISMTALSRIAYVWHDRDRPRALSELAAAEDTLLVHFRNVLWACGTLFAVAVYGAIVPDFAYPGWLFVAWTVTYAGDVLLAAIPARDDTFRFHIVCAQAMAAGMLAMAYLFFAGLWGGLGTAELVVALAMTLLAVLTVADKVRYVFYELGFLYLSHISIVLAAVCVLPK